MLKNKQITRGSKKKLNNGEIIKDYNEKEKYKILKEVGLISVKPYIIVCNVDENNVKVGNNYTKSLKRNMQMRNL